MKSPKVEVSQESDTLDSFDKQELNLESSGPVSASSSTTPPSTSVDQVGNGGLGAEDSDRCLEMDLFKIAEEFSIDKQEKFLDIFFGDRRFGMA